MAQPPQSRTNTYTTHTYNTHNTHTEEGVHVCIMHVDKQINNLTTPPRNLPAEGSITLDRHVVQSSKQYSVIHEKDFRLTAFVKRRICSLLYKFSSYQLLSSRENRFKVQTIDNFNCTISLTTTSAFRSSRNAEILPPFEVISLAVSSKCCWLFEQYSLIPKLPEQYNLNSQQNLQTASLLNSNKIKFQCCLRRPLISNCMKSETLFNA